MAEPTMSLADFIAGQEKDPNLFWRLASGDHQNLLDEAIEVIEFYAEQHGQPAYRAREALGRVRSIRSYDAKETTE